MIDKFLKIESHNHRLNFTYFIIGGLLSGIAVGLLLDDSAADLQILGDIYIGLLQMTVMPYIVFSLIANIGRLSYFEARLLLRQGLLVLLALWLIGGVLVWGVSFSLPDFEQGAFFSSLLVADTTKIDFFKALYSFQSVPVHGGQRHSSRCFIQFVVWYRLHWL